jgi:hypothetical protein
MQSRPWATQGVLLRRQGLVFAEDGVHSQPDDVLEAFEIELAQLGYAVSTRLRDRLSRNSPAALGTMLSRIRQTLLANVGGDRQHQPLFRRFPDGIPADTYELWCRKVLSHFMQDENQPCLFCRRVGTTHVLNPCQHVVCDQCFDGTNYLACPVCEHHVDRTSPFFKPTAPRSAANERVRMKLLDLGSDFETEARAQFTAFCARKQAMSPVDKEDFTTLIESCGPAVLAWLPAEVPLRENVALVFGVLLRSVEPLTVLEAARGHLKTATDVLRLIAAYSGADAALQGQMVMRPREVADLRLIPKFAHWFKTGSWIEQHRTLALPVLIKRFNVAKLRRPLRKALLAFLEGLHADALAEDMLRHRSYWVWVGEFLHPHEYAQRFPNVARAFAIVRKKAPDGAAAPAFKGFYAQLEAAAVKADAKAMTALLQQRPGELARRLDHVLRIAGNDFDASNQTLAALTKSMPQLSTPVLLTLRALLPTRRHASRKRIFWPKGTVAKGVFANDRRPTLPSAVIEAAIPAIEAELLRRFGVQPKFDEFLIDTALRDVMVPFNERTASKSAIQLPRGSTIDVTLGKTVRLFLHWCQPNTDRATTDLDLSIGFYDSNWTYKGVCSYYQLKFSMPGRGQIAVSAGDLRDAPFPDGASEFVDLDREAALDGGIRYAVAVLNNYSGLAFEELERAFAGLMLRDDVHGTIFDPRTVELKFDLQGGNGVFLPLVLDIAENKLHWLDVYATGEFDFNNLVTSNRAIQTICPEMIAYFGSGIRTSMYDLALLHAAARGNVVTLRGKGSLTIRRASGEPDAAFLARLRAGEGETSAERPNSWVRPIFAVLSQGDVVLPEGSVNYALMPGMTVGGIAASDLIV